VLSGILRKISRKHIQCTAAPNNTIGSLPNLLLLLPKIPNRRPPAGKQYYTSKPDSQPLTQKIMIR